MPHYLSPDNRLYFLDDAKFEDMIPEGCARISDAQAAAITRANIAAGMPAALAAEVRLQRTARLDEADRKVNTLEDNGKDASAWRAYRQALRDVPQQAGFPTTIDWPTAPQ
jgi:hypothetical protein